ncbi:MAG: serine/threonine protein kinase, partial [Candidatus Krumholzibacteriota bacterium]|nr:serine/threonine protein kinase [Candidatus Krumholzibacteriota bacterium]
MTRRRYVMIAAVIAAGVICIVVGDATLERAFSGRSKTEKFTGIFGAKSDGEQRRDTASRVLHVIVWAAGVGVIATRFLLDAPGGSSPPSAGEKSLRPSTGARRVAGRFEIVARLGRGATGAVYEANDVVLDRPIALKELSLTITDDDTRERFRREARILARLNHPGIVQVYDFIEEEDRVWIAMELVRGGDLTTLMRNNKPMAPGAVVSLGVQMADALAFAHERNVIHRDLKPLNILLVDDNTPKITDFGLAKFTEGSVHTIEGTILGSPYYMSPEQADGRPVELRSDIYSLGAVFYHMLCGKPPF